MPLNLPPRLSTKRGRCQHTLAGSFYKRHAVRQVLTPEDVSDRLPPTACQCRGSEALSSPSRGAFHLSLTVLVHYRWPGVSAPWRVVPPASHRISRVPWYSGIRSPDHVYVGYGPLTLSGACFPAASPTHMLVQVNDRSLQPHIPVAQDGFGLLPFRSPLLRESRLISLPPGTEMFQF